ncbi:antichymotrypsin-2-like [Drosophila montana]|uniref:antichymotrypsin-2-like n=1 Tax=Drosophila montana TaxID=40370 RepID=UPI00313CC4B0
MIFRLVTLTLCTLGLAQADLFTSQLFSSLATKDNRDNLVISPPTIRASLALLYAGAEGDAALELKERLQLRGHTKDVALSEFRQQPLRIATWDVKLFTIYKLYVDVKYTIKPSFQHLAITNLQTLAEHVNFSLVKLMAHHISVFVEINTLHKLKDTLSPAEISSATQSFLVQGFYFSGKFARPFHRFKEHKPFFFDPFHSVSVATYIKDDNLFYGDIPLLMSRAIEIPYKNSKLSLLIILPYERTFDLNMQEEILKSMDIRFLDTHFQSVNVRVQIPRFKIEYETYLKDALGGIGISRIFNNSDLSDLSSTPDLRVTNIKHRGVFELNDDCARCNEPAANNSDIRQYFIADHPFLFAVKDLTKVYLVGRVMKPV